MTSTKKQKKVDAIAKPTKGNTIQYVTLYGNFCILIMPVGISACAAGMKTSQVAKDY